MRTAYKDFKRVINSDPVRTLLKYYSRLVKWRRWKGTCFLREERNQRRGAYRMENFLLRNFQSILCFSSIFFYSLVCRRICILCVNNCYNYADIGCTSGFLNFQGQGQISTMKIPFLLPEKDKSKGILHWALKESKIFE